MRLTEGDRVSWRDLEEGPPAYGTVIAPGVPSWRIPPEVLPDIGAPVYIDAGRLTLERRAD
jgi:hypothetical protein